MRMTRNLIKKFNPKRVIIAWDVGKSQERLEIYPEYKANRLSRDPQITKDIARQQVDCQKIFETLPVRQIAVNGVEADDIIGNLCERLKGKKLVLSNDQDFVQLVSNGVHLYLPKQEKLLTGKSVDKFLGFPVKHYVLWKSMVGDSSDNIKGIKGIGKVRATAIIRNGVGGKKKLPIQPAEMEILERNKYLIALGAILQPSQAKAIRKQFKQQIRKNCAYEPVRQQFMKMGFKSLYRGFDDWSQCFNRLKKNEGKMQWVRKK